MSEKEAIRKLIEEVDAVGERREHARNHVPRRIFLLFALVVPFALCLMWFAVRHGRRDRPVR
ncbi:MAG: hypothetical protein NTV70_11745 [Acidobacteria bacterium]|jgi:hypothetical protein|nr:hypothetical protein [Acidobacteriota bacterium]